VPESKGSGILDLDTVVLQLSLYNGDLKALNLHSPWGKTSVVAIDKADHRKKTVTTCT
jgi:hypothetical protein